MAAIATIVGRFIGAVLAECGPVIVEIIREIRKPTAEDSKAPTALHDRLKSLISRLPDSGN